MTKAQDIPGFEDFLQLKKFAQLCGTGKIDPVVVINVHKCCCDALALVDGLDKVVHIPLHSLSYGKAQQLHDLLSQKLSAAGVCIQDIQATRIATTTKIEAVEFVLSNLWLSIAKPVLDGLTFTVSYLSIIC